MSLVLLFIVTTSPCQDWVICMLAAFLGCGSCFSGSLSLYFSEFTLWIESLNHHVLQVFISSMYLIICLYHVPITYTKITNKIPLTMHHTLHKSNITNPHINHVPKPHCYTTSICTNNFTNIPEPKSL
jgi:hypothetical protein